jgi:H/ACA ribonucleoprotein complex subunit 4
MEFITKSHDIGQTGGYPGARPIEELLRNGIIVLDKWSGPTSHDVAATVKKTLGLTKAGQAGTLDPQVTGVLIVTLENACKVIPALQKADKEYIGIMRMHTDVTIGEVREAAKQFIGKIKQLPPVRSAVARRERERNIYSLDILEMDGRDVLFHTTCQSGTYVRVLCHEIGKKLGGANMIELRRTRSGRFSEKQAVRMEDVADAYAEWKENGGDKIRKYILPVEEAAEDLGKIIIKDNALLSVANGSPLYTVGIARVSDNVKKDDLVAIFSLKGELVALAKANMDAKDMSRKGIAAKTDRVIIDKKKLTA